MSKETVKDLLVGVGFVLVEVLIFQHLSFFGITADPLLIFILWIALKYERFQLILITAVLAFLQDALFDYWGLNLFAKTLMIFVIYNFISRWRESRLLLWQIFVVVFLAALFHNLLFIGLAGVVNLASVINIYSVGLMPIIFVLGSSLYTALLGSMLFIFKGN